MKHHLRATLVFTMICTMLLVTFGASVPVSARSIYDDFSISCNHANLTLYTNGEPMRLFVTLSNYVLSHTKQEYESARMKLYNQLTWSTSNPDVVQFITATNYDSDTPRHETAATLEGRTGYANCHASVIGLSEGTSTITIRSPKLKTTLTCTITVKHAALTCADAVFYTGNSYAFSMAGNAVAASFASSNPAVAVIDSATGMLRTKKAGKAIISCTTTEGNVYKYKLSVKKAGLSYKTLTTYYYTGFSKGAYTYFPLLANGIKVKKWKSSNNKVCKPISYGSACSLQMRGTGKCTITCIAKDGQKYKCKLTVVGGKTWGGLNRGYRPTLSAVKKHGYFKDINKIKDYGKAIVTIVETNHEIPLKNGNPKMEFSEGQNAKTILSDRYPNAQIQELILEDYLIFTNDKKTKSGHLFVMCYYIDED